MNFGNPNSDSTPQPSIPSDLQSHCVTGIMEMMTSRNRSAPPSQYSSSSGSIPGPHQFRSEMEKKRFLYSQRSQSGNSSISSRSRLLPSGYFSLESLFLLIGLTASLLILPLILPPLPPPPFLLLLIPIGILVLLMFLALTPNARDMTTYTSL